MKVALINSRQDKAGVNIRHHIEQLLDSGTPGGDGDPNRTYDFYDVAERLIHAEHIDTQINADLLIFLHGITVPIPFRSSPCM